MHGNCDRMWLALLGSWQIFSEDIFCSVSGAFLVRPVLGRSCSYQHAEPKGLINCHKLINYYNLFIYIYIFLHLIISSSEKHLNNIDKIHQSLKGNILHIIKNAQAQALWTFTMRCSSLQRNVRLPRFPPFPVALCFRWLRAHLPASRIFGWPSRPHGPRASHGNHHATMSTRSWKHVIFDLNLLIRWK